MHGRGAERLHVDRARPREPASFGDGLRCVPSPSLVPVADGLLAATDGMGDRVGVDTGAREEVTERLHAARLDREVLQQHPRRERLVMLVIAGERTHHLGAAVQRKLPRLGFLLQAHQVELIDLGEQVVEGFLIQQVAEAPRGRGVPDGVTPPLPRAIPQVLRREVAEEDLVGRIGHGSFERAERGGELVETRGLA